jgi:hypothetical protein
MNVRKIMRLSILIPARNEEYLQNTIDDIKKHAEGDIEILTEEDVVPIGQRALTNKLAKQATGDYLMKCDAHVSFSQGFDVELLKLKDEATVVVPALTNLHVYDWLCPAGHRKQGEQFEYGIEHCRTIGKKIIKVCDIPLEERKMLCERCGEEMAKELVWRPIPKPIITNCYLDMNLLFQYCPEQEETPITETMSMQGSCFMISKEDYFRLNICDEKFGSWGQQGAEVSLKSWLSGGRVIATRNCFYSHWHRIFPYKNPVERIIKTQKDFREMFLENKWPGQIRSLQSLIEQFDFPGDWDKNKVEELCSPYGNR